MDKQEVNQKVAVRVRTERAGGLLRTQPVLKKTPNETKTGNSIQKAH